MAKGLRGCLQVTEKDVAMIMIHYLDQNVPILPWLDSLFSPSPSLSLPHSPLLSEDLFMLINFLLAGIILYFESLFFLMLLGLAVWSCRMRLLRGTLKLLPGMLMLLQGMLMLVFVGQGLIWIMVIVVLLLNMEMLTQKGMFILFGIFQT